MSDRPLISALKKQTDLMRENLLTVKQATSQFSQKPAPATIRNWISRGIFHQGELIFLESLKIGGKLFTTQEAVQRFVERTNP